MTFNVRRMTGPARVTHEGAPAYDMDAAHELYLLVVSSLMSGDSYCESADERLARLRELVATTIARGEAEFIVALAAYAREQMHMRTAPAVLVGELYLHRLEDHAMRAARRVWVRGDEHLDTLAYVDAVGAKRTKALLRGVAERLGTMTGRQFVKYSSGRKSYSQRDAIRIAHPVPRSIEQSALFRYMVRGWDELDGDSRMLLPDEILALRSGEAMTWEQLISENGSNTESWTRAIPLMGYMALIRNLRNLVDNNVPAEEITMVASRIADPAAVAKSKQLPFRFLSAYRTLPPRSPRILIDALNIAADCAVANVPDLAGDSLLCVDVSGSMTGPVSGKSTVTMMDAAACLGSILAHRGGCDLWAFGTNAARVKVPTGNPVLSTTTAVIQENEKLGWGANIGLALECGLRPGLARAIVLTDMQSHDYAMGTAAGWLKDNPGSTLYVVDLSSCGRPRFDPKYRNVVLVGGFSDRVFEWINAVEDSNPVEKVMSYGRLA